MLSIVVVPLVLQVVAPLVLLSWMALGDHGSRLAWAAAFVLVSFYLLVVAAAGLWLPFPWYVAYAFLLLFPLAAAWSARRAVRAPWWPTRGRARAALAGRSALAAVAVVAALDALAGRRLPDGPVVDLAFPLDGGSFYIVNGGSAEILNAHLRTISGEGRFAAYRGQSHGVDIVALGRWGARASAPLPDDPAAYAIFGLPVLAPCAGTVVLASDSLADLAPPAVDREHMAGNHVVLSCGDAWIVLAHLRRGSVCVRAGDSVRVGAPLGEVGNTGNSTEPHLHIHAQRPGSGAAPLGGAPLPVRFEGHYLARNAVVVLDRGTRP
jgi:hypothetical protein